MDERFRRLEREFEQTKSADSLIQLLHEYARLGRIPAGDIKALSLIAPWLQANEHYSPSWYLDFTPDQIQSLLDIGYPIGVYLNVHVKRRVPAESKLLPPTLPELAQATVNLLAEQAEQIHTRLSGGRTLYMPNQIDDYLLGPYTSKAKAPQKDGRLLYRHHIDAIIKQLRMPNDLASTIVRFSSIISPVTSGGIIGYLEGRRRATPGTRRWQRATAQRILKIGYRIFIPAMEIERAFRLSPSLGTLRAPGTRGPGSVFNIKSILDWRPGNNFLRIERTLGDHLTAAINHLSSDIPSSIHAKVGQMGVNLLLGLSCFHPFRQYSWLRPFDEVQDDGSPYVDGPTGPQG